MQNDPLSQLRDIHLPDPISYWPPAIGWWLLVVLLFILASFMVIYVVRWYHKRSYRRHAIKALNTLYKAYKKEKDSALYTFNINMLLKRSSVFCYGKNRVSKLTGDDWLGFLDDSGNTTDFTQGAGIVLASAPYTHAADIDAIALKQCCESWIRRHRS